MVRWQECACVVSMNSTMEDRAEATAKGPNRVRTHGNLFRFPAGSRFESCGVAVIDCPACGVRVLADGVSVKSADGLRETHRHLRCRLCGCPSQLKGDAVLLTDILPPDDRIYPSEALIARSQPGLRLQPVPADQPQEQAGMPRHARAFLAGTRYELEKPRSFSLIAFLWPAPFGGLLSIGILAYGVFSLTGWIGCSQNVAIVITASAGLLFLLVGVSLRRTNLRVAATREACAAYCWRVIERFGGTQDDFRDLAKRLGQDYQWVGIALERPLPFVESGNAAQPLDGPSSAHAALPAEAVEPEVTPDPESRDGASSQVPLQAAQAVSCESDSGQTQPDTAVAKTLPASRIVAVDRRAEAVLAALNEQPKPRSAQQGLMLLIISMVLFMAMGAMHSALENLAILIVLLLIHEGGHYVAMRLFGFRDVRVFFIPFLGAATTSSDAQQAPEWKHAVVSLAGPVPGLGIGLMLGAGWALTGHGLMGQAALFFVLLNGFNLLPFLPLDGGHLLDHVIFCRHRTLELVFRVLAALGLLAIALSMDAWLLAVFALLPLLALPNFMKNTRIADGMRREAPVPEDGLPPLPPREVALLILPRVQQAFPQMREPKLLADQIRNVWTYYGVRPPGVGATIALLGTYALSIVGTIVLGAVVIFMGFRLASNRYQDAMKTGKTALMQRSYSEAERKFAQAVRDASLFRESRAPHAVALSQQAVALLELGQLDAADDLLARAQAEFAECRDSEQFHLASLYETRARVMLGLGRGREAAAYYHASVLQYEEYLGGKCDEAQDVRRRAAERLAKAGYDELSREFKEEPAPPAVP